MFVKYLLSGFWHYAVLLVDTDPLEAHTCLVPFSRMNCTGYECGSLYGVSSKKVHVKSKGGRTYKNKICTVNKIKIKSCYVTHDDRRFMFVWPCIIIVGK